MRNAGRNPSTHVANVVGDALLDIDPATARLDDVIEISARNKLNDRLLLMPPSYYPSAHERRCTAHHEAGHVMAALEAGAESIEVRMRETGGGVCVASAIHDIEARIRYALAGAFADIKFNPRSIHSYYTHPPCSDFLLARAWIDDRNASRLWPKLTYRTAAKDAMRFVEKHWRQIQNLALALNDGGELDDYSIRLFASCRP